VSARSRIRWRRLGARLILQQALEDEVTEFLGRRRYERTGAPVAHRKGYEPRKVKTTSGAVELVRPRVRDASRLGFESGVLGGHVTRTYALESLVIARFCAGSRPETWRPCSRDLRGAGRLALDRVTHPRGHQGALRRWCERRLEEHDVVYLLPRRHLPQAAPRTTSRRGLARGLSCAHLVQRFKSSGAGMEAKISAPHAGVAVV
jgi:hypothetical protein